MMTNGLYTSNKQDWSTPEWLFKEIDAVFHFTLDVAANTVNHKCSKWFGDIEIAGTMPHKHVFIDGLKQDWSGHACWMNPPYGREIGKWTEKANLESIRNGVTVIGLLPARTDTRWFISACCRPIILIKGRVSFGSYDGDGYKESPAPFPSVIVGWGDVGEKFIQLSSLGLCFLPAGWRL